MAFQLFQTCPHIQSYNGEISVDKLCTHIGLRTSGMMRLVNHP